MVAHISAETAHYLVEQFPIDFVFLDVRRKDELSHFGSIEYSFNLPKWDSAFELSESEFSEKYQFTKPKVNDNLILCSRTSERRAVSAAEKAEKLGYQRVAVVTGGIRQYSLYDTRVKFYEAFTEGQAPPTAVTTDISNLRRKDELENYGAYPKALNLPTEECFRAIQLTDGDWEREYGFAKPHVGQLVLLYCRSNRRAKYVYQVFQNAGWEKEGIKLLVFADGVAGLSRLTPAVKAYDSYEETDPLPPVIPPVNPLY